ncbi:hypothetical protein EH165_11145 [Nakamurella antarctica]|uniref:Transcriptional regulator, AbiEi antitoxin, Type IV TA system n=1 Tax=Nakamurella antarctica TaxID=1902245 RepID=A0A3G8ZP94_9ACTN|nr:hypothetical protein [Nakamurella antarctica]AZI58605.1 hypothetical protein EH165_11145 [Nakamurella antarctica]
MPDDAVRPMFRQDLLREGTSDQELRGHLRSERWIPVVPGAYLPHGVAAQLSNQERYGVLIASALPKLGERSVLSHQSAAHIHGLPLWGIDMSKVHVTRPKRSGGRQGPTVVSHARLMDSRDWALIGDHMVTSVARTVVDLAAALPMQQGVVIADAALHRKLVTPQQLSECLAEIGRRPGIGRARATVAFANGLSESVGESRSRVLMHKFQMPVPELQMDIFDEDGRFLARSDFGFKSQRTLGESDGFVKYSRYLRPGETPADAVFREKRREDSVRDRSWEMVRWVWPELDHFGVVYDRFRRAFRRGALR